MVKGWGCSTSKISSICCPWVSWS